jgi:hypothetical protein
MEATINDPRLNQVLNESLDVIHRLLKTKSDDELTQTDLQRIKTANIVLTSYPRYGQTNATTAHVALEILKAASENEEQYRSFVRQHVPYSGVLKTVPKELLGGRKDIFTAEEKAQSVEERYLTEKQSWQNEKAELLFKIQQLEHK